MENLDTEIKLSARFQKCETEHLDLYRDYNYNNEF